MEAEIVFNKRMSIVFANGREQTLDYFLSNDIPVIKYNSRGYSFCSSFRELGWTTEKEIISEDKKVIFLYYTENNLYNWCSVYHELGHITNNHPLSSDGRLDGIREGIVSVYELEADKNVFKNMGREKTEMWLNHLASRLSKEIELREYAKTEGRLNSQGEKILERFYLSKEEILLRIKYL
ncbi:hypothetical protein [Paenibacillus polymyxa]|uniref:hypothetical protein n=1 Tax=Paenibacillus polymyxa TaxID=1406 RepID=UPI001118E9C5|nr:hypothetical protein [Paenibacillus polymyxa]QDA29714.1 hypothetical protein FGY93_23625 [Paenibacillus polymyxa]